MGRRLERLLLGLLGLGLAVWLSGAIVSQAEQAAKRGDAEMRRDALLMLWSPLVFGVAGAGFLVRALVLPGEASARSPRRWRPWGGAVGAAPTPTKPAQPSRYLAACRELGLEPGSSWAVVRATWRRQLRQWHPDHGGDPQLWIRRQAAYQLLEAWESFGNLNQPR